MPYLYETHLHTCQGSKCGRSTGAEQARFYKEAGYQGVIITDHFCGGNTAMPKEGSWKERINLYCKGYEDALEEGKKIGLDVFFGLEECFARYDGGHDEYEVAAPLSTIVFHKLSLFFFFLNNNIIHQIKHLCWWWSCIRSKTKRLQLHTQQKS